MSELTAPFKSLFSDELYNLAACKQQNMLSFVHQFVGRATAEDLKTEELEDRTVLEGFAAVNRL